MSKIIKFTIGAAGTDLVFVAAYDLASGIDVESYYDAFHRDSKFKALQILKAGGKVVVTTEIVEEKEG